MKKYIISSIGAAVMFLFGSCSSDIPEMPVTDSDALSEVTLQICDITVEGQSRAIVDQFKPGDKMGLFIYGDDKNLYASNCANVSATMNENRAWVMDESIELVSGRTAYVIAYYPYTDNYQPNVNGGLISFDEAGLDFDLLCSGCHTVSASGSVSLRFRHEASKITFKVRKTANYSGDGQIEYVRITPNMSQYYSDGTWKDGSYTSISVPAGFRNCATNQYNMWYSTTNWLDVADVVFNAQLTEDYLSQTVLLNALHGLYESGTPSRYSSKIVVRVDGRDIVVADQFEEPWSSLNSYTYQITVDSDPTSRSGSPFATMEIVLE